MPGQSFPGVDREACRGLLELLVRVDNLYSMLVMLLCGLLAHICEVAINRHDGRGRGMPSVGRRSTG